MNPFLNFITSSFNLKSCAFSLTLILITQPAFTQVMPCYDSNVYSSFYNLNAQLDNTSYPFQLPIAFTPKMEEQIFNKPLMWERSSLWNANVRQERYEYILMDLALLSNYEPAKKRAMEEFYLEQAPSLVKFSILYPLLKNFIALNIDLDNTLTDISSAYKPLGEISDVIDGLVQIADMIVPPSGIEKLPQEVINFFGSKNCYLLLDKSTLTITRKWLEKFSLAAKIASYIGIGIDLNSTQQHAITAAFFSQILANEAAISRINEIESCLSKDSYAYRDNSFKQALNNIKIYLNESSSERMYTAYWNSIKDNSIALKSGGIKLAFAFFSKPLISLIESYAMNSGAHLAIKAIRIGGLWGLGLWALEQEVLMFLEINEQLEDSELSVCYATIGYDLCIHSNGNCKLRVPIMYAFLRSAESIVKLADYSPYPFYRPNAEVKTIWQGISNDFKQRLDEQSSISCKIEPGNLINGKVAPVSGTSNDTYTFSVIYINKNINPQPPSEVKLLFDNQVLLMQKKNIEDNNYNNGVEYNYIFSSPSLGTHNYNFTAKDYLGTALLNYPETGKMNLYVSQSSYGWAAEVDPSTTNYTPSSVIKGTILTVTTGIKNTGQNTYSNISGTIEMRNSQGTVVSSTNFETGSLDPGNTKIIKSQLTVPSNGIDGSYSLTSIIYPNLDSNSSNNSYSNTFFIEENLGNEQFRSNGIQTIRTGTPLTINNGSTSQNFYLNSISAANEFAVFRDPRGSVSNIYSGRIKIYGPFDCFIQNESVFTDGKYGYAVVNGAYAIKNGPIFEKVEINASPGEIVELFADAPSILQDGNQVQCLFSDMSGDFELFSPSTTDIKKWFSQISKVENFSKIKITFEIPPTAPIGKTVLYFKTLYSNTNIIDFTRLTFYITNPPPIISTLSKLVISADDQITITGKNFQSSGTVFFGVINATITSWTNTSITCTVPQGINVGVVTVANSNGPSNGLAYSILSATGTPVLNYAIPDQTMGQSESRFIANLNDVFSDPNNESLKFTQTSDNHPEIEISTSELLLGNLRLTTSENFLEDANITITATDNTEKSISDNFVILASKILKVTPPVSFLESTSGATILSIKSNVEWEISGSSDWASASKTNSTTLTITYNANTKGYNRTASFTISGKGVTPQIVTVNQTGATPSLNVNPNSETVGPNSGSAIFTVNSNVDWYASSDQSWCQVSYDNATGQLIATYGVNTEKTDHTANIKVYALDYNLSQTVTLTQTKPPCILTTPVIGDITQPDCNVTTGSVVLNGLPASGIWTLTQTPGNLTGFGNGTTTIISGLTTGTYTFTVTNESNCTSPPSEKVEIIAAPPVPKAPVIDLITHPTCFIPTGSIDVSGLPETGTWTLTRHPDEVIISDEGSTKNIPGIVPGSYTFTVENSFDCKSLPSEEITIKPKPLIPETPQIQSTDQPTCSNPKGSVTLTGLPSSSWTITGVPGDITRTGTESSITIPDLDEGTYNFTVSNGSCTSAQSDKVVIKPQPIKPEITNQDITVKSGKSFTYIPPQAPSGTTYTWTVPAYTGEVSGGTEEPVPQNDIHGTLNINSGKGTAIYTITPTLESCTGNSFTLTIEVTSDCIPVNIETEPVSSTICPSEDAILNVTTKGSYPQSYQWQYYNGQAWVNITNRAPIGTIYEDVNNSGLKITGLTPGSYQYRCLITNCTSSNVTSKTATIKVAEKPLPIEVKNTIQPSCIKATGSVMLNGLPSGNWTINPGNIEGSGSSATIDDLDPGKYSFTVTNEEGCTSDPVEVTIDPQPEKPQKPIFENTVQPTCTKATGSVTFKGLPSGNWTINPGNITGSRSSVTIDNLDPGKYPFNVTNEEGCTSDPVEVVIDPQPQKPQKPVVENTVQPTCTTSKGSVTLKGLPSGNWTINPGSITGSGSSKTIDTLTPGQYAFTVSNKDGCTSEPSDLITIQSQPLSAIQPQSVTANSDICPGTSTTLHFEGGSGETFVWYTVSCGGTMIGTGNDGVVTPEVTTTYYGRWEAKCGNSDCKQVTVKVKPLPVEPTSVVASKASINSGESTTLKFSGGSGEAFVWYSGSCGEKRIGTGNDLPVSPTVTTSYFGRWENACDHSNCKEVTVTVKSIPVAPTSVKASDTTICPGNSTILSYEGGSGESFVWYSGSCGGTQIGTGTNLSVRPTATTTYYGRWESNSINSDCKQVKVSVQGQPIAPLSTKVSDSVICPGNSIILHYEGGSGETFVWYTEECGETKIGTGNDLVVSPTTATTTYYGRWENSCGNSDCKQVTVIVKPFPIEPTSVDASNTSINPGESTTLKYTGGSGENFVWYSGSCGEKRIGTGNDLPVFPAVTTTYFGRWENPCGTSGCKEVTVFVNAPLVPPDKVSAADTSICSGNSTTLYYEGGSGETFVWYSGSCGETKIGTGNNVPVQPTVTTTYYGRWENKSGTTECKMANIRVKSIPDSPDTILGKNEVREDSTEEYKINPVEGAKSYTWKFPDGWHKDPITTSVDNISVKIKKPDGQISVTANNECGSSIPISINIKVTGTSIDRLNKDNIEIYPNPFSDELQIIFHDEYSGKVVIEITDMFGKKIFIKTLPKVPGNLIEIIQANSLPVGVFTMKIYGKDWFMTRKIIKTW